MRRLGLIAAIVMAAVILPFVMTFGTAEGVEADPDPASDTARPGSNVTLCHIPPGNPAAAHVITVGSPAVPAHLAHGDVITTSCPTPTATPTPTSTPTPLPTPTPTVSPTPTATTDANPDCFAHAHRHAYGDPDCYADTHRHAYGNPDCYADTNRYADANPERHARTHRDAYTSTNANPDCYAHTPGHVQPGRWPYVR